MMDVRVYQLSIMSTLAAILQVGMLASFTSLPFQLFLLTSTPPPPPPFSSSSPPPSPTPQLFCGRLPMQPH